MTRLYVAAENIPAGSGVEVRGPSFSRAYAIDRAERSLKIMIGTAAENLREGFRIVSRAGNVYEDDA